MTHGGHGDQAAWRSALYDEEYDSINGWWMFQKLKLTSHFWTAFDQGWVKTRVV